MPVRAWSAEDGADLGDVESDVDDQVAGKGVAQIVETQPPPVAIETRVDGRPDAVPASRRCGARTPCHGRWRARNQSRVEAGAAFVLRENRCELGGGAGSHGRR